MAHLNKKNLKRVTELAEGGSYVYVWGYVNNIFGIDHINAGQYDKRFRDMEDTPHCLFHYSTGSGRVMVTDCDVLAMQKTREKTTLKRVDVLYSYLRLAQRNSDDAKNIGWIFLSNRNPMDVWRESRKAKDSFYFQKWKYIIKAAKRAKKLGIRVVYDPKERCVYFELSRGQVSFHTIGNDTELLLPYVEEIRGYQWSGQHDSAFIIDSYFEDRE